MYSSYSRSAFDTLDDSELARWMLGLLYTGRSSFARVSSASPVSSQLYDLFGMLSPEGQLRFYDALATAASSLEVHESKAGAIRETVALIGLTRNVVAVPALVHLLSESAARLAECDDSHPLVVTMELCASVVAGLSSDPSVRSFCLTQLRWIGTDIRLLSPMAAGLIAADPSTFADVLHELLRRMPAASHERIVDMLNELPSHIALERLAEELPRLDKLSILPDFARLLQRGDSVLRFTVDGEGSLIIWDTVLNVEVPVLAPEVCNSPEVLDLLLRDKMLSGLTLVE